MSLNVNHNAISYTPLITPAMRNGVLIPTNCIIYAAILGPIAKVTLLGRFNNA